MSNLFSKREKPEPDTLSYEIPQRVRTRIARTLTEMIIQYGGNVEFLMRGLSKRIFMEYGEADARKGMQSLEVDEDIAREHFVACSVDRAIDFIEMVFESVQYRGFQAGVDAVNAIFREEGIGFEFSPFPVSDNTGWVQQFLADGAGAIRFPQGTKKSNELVHSTTVMPALNLLANGKFQVANKEMLDAHKHFRAGDFTAAINSAGQSFESVLKTICADKKWLYDPHKDTLATLVEICRKNDLFPQFYVEIFKASGTIRNKFGSHGQGPVPVHGNPDKEHAEHLIQQNSAHILLVARLARMA